MGKYISFSNSVLFSKLGKTGALLLCAALIFSTRLYAAPPTVTNIRAAQRPGTQLVDVLYNLSAVGPCSVTMAVSANGGTNYSVPVFTLTGAVGSGVSPGNDRAIVWNAGQDWPGQFTDKCRVRVTADDGTSPTPPPAMVIIPSGSFNMGDNYVESGNAFPVHSVFISGFYMDKFEVTSALWDDVYFWAVANGYTFSTGFSNNVPSHARGNMTWYDAVKWCNARSEKAGLSPVYFRDATQTTVYRINNLNLTNGCVKWTANGYRLPTEAEWEKAARGGINGHHFPWPSLGGAFNLHINGSKANYESSGDPFSNYTTPVGYYNGSQIPAGVDMANGYGLYDMAGNVSELCWDFYDANWYGQPGAVSNDSHGPANALGTRSLRGGGWADSTSTLRCAQRLDTFPSSPSSYYGFRCVRGF